MGDWIGAVFLFGMAAMCFWLASSVLRIKREGEMLLIGAFYSLFGCLALYWGLNTVAPRLVRWLDPALPFVGIAFLFVAMLAFFSFAFSFFRDREELRQSSGRYRFPMIYSVVFLVAGLTMVCALIAIGLEALEGNLPDFSR